MATILASSTFSFTPIVSAELVNVGCWIDRRHFLCHSQIPHSLAERTPLNTPSIPIVIPPIYGLRGVEYETYTGDGPISYWNSYVGVGQMGGQGNFSDSRIGLVINQTPDLVTPKL